LTRYVAFLRAINVGGRFVRMPALVECFEGMQFADVSTFIASGNVIFRAVGSVSTLTEQIEGGLQRALGFEVSAFLRTDTHIGRLALRFPLTEDQLTKAQTVNVIFLARPMNPEQSAKLESLRTPVDDFVVAGSELFWLCRVQQSESEFSNALLERRLRIRATLRTLGTVQRLAATLAIGDRPVRPLT
jgi:uncharacterized protein (DUF1697 family)